MVFVTSLIYVEVVARVSKVLNWMDPRKKIELDEGIILGRDKE
jgi:hypothetical protein